MKYSTILLGFIATWQCEAFDWIAHRGNARGAIENSIEAVTASWQLGVDAIEIDVRVSTDGVVYLYHDDDINGKYVIDLTYSEITGLVPQGSAPKLASILAVDNATGHYLLDFKSPTSADVEKLAPIIRAAPIPADRIIIQSDNVDIIRAFSNVLPDCPYFYLERLDRTQPFYLPPKPHKILSKFSNVSLSGLSIKGRRFIDADYVASLKSSGLKVYVWTINEPQRAAYYRRIGVDGVITDKVETLRESLKEPIEQKL